MFRILIAIGVVLCCGTVAVADDWPDFRGPGRRGISQESGWRANWTAGGPVVLWKVQVGIGSSSCIIVGDRLYTMGANRDDREAVICLDASTGRELWRQEYRCPFEERMFEGGPAGTPVFNEGRIYTLSYTGDLSCWNAEDGRPIWQRHLERDFKGVRPRWGWAASPLVAGNMVIVEPGGNGTSVVALHKLTGALLWRKGADPAAYASPVIFSGTALRGVALFNAYGLIGINPRNGAELFRHRWNTPFDANASEPVHNDGRFLLSSGYGQGSAVVGLTAGNPAVVWEDRGIQLSFQNGVLFGNHVYLVNGDEDASSLQCIDFKTGAGQWIHDLKNKGPGNVIAAGGLLIVSTRSGDLLLAEATPAGFRESGRIRPVDGPVRASPAFSDARLFLRNTRGTLIALDLRNGG